MAADNASTSPRAAQSQIIGAYRYAGVGGSGSANGSRLIVPGVHADRRDHAVRAEYVDGCAIGGDRQREGAKSYKAAALGTLRRKGRSPGSSKRLTGGEADSFACMAPVVDRIELPPSTGSLGGSYELSFDGRILTVMTRWKKREHVGRYDVGMAVWKLWESAAGFTRQRQVWFSIHTPPKAEGGEQLSAAGFDADVLREFVERVFRARSGIAASSILGRALVVAARKQASGDLVECTVTAAVRLADGTPPYQATVQAKVVQHRADLLQPGRTILAVRAGINDHSRVEISWAENVPVVTVTDPAITEPPERALRDGEPCRIVVLALGREHLKTPAGSELYASKVRVVPDGAELQVQLLVPENAASLLAEGRELPAKRLAAEPAVLAVDWAAALPEAGQGPADGTRGRPGVQSDPIERLGKLADLRDRGVLTDAEFAAEKAWILSES